MGFKQRIIEAIRLAFKYGGIDESHHKAWVIDQMIRILAGPDYDSIIKLEASSNGGTYEWDTGIAP